MKKIINYLLVSILVLLPFCVNAKESVKITEVKMLDKTDYTDVISEATYEGLNINFNVKFNQEKDNIRYQVTIKNEDSEDYELTESNAFKESKYIDYKVEYSGGNVVKANSTKTAIITITYAHKVPQDKYVNGRYEEPNKFSISLSNNKVNNPKTSSKLLILGLILGLLIVGSIIVIKGNTKTKLISILIGLLVLPITTLALTKITITVNSKVIIEREAEFCVSAYDEDADQIVQENLKFEPGMSWYEYLNSDLNTKFGLLTDNAGSETLTTTRYSAPYMFASYEYITCQKNIPNIKGTKKLKEDPCSEYFHESLGPDAVVKPKSVGCYLTEIESSSPKS